MSGSTQQMYHYNIIQHNLLKINKCYDNVTNNRYIYTLLHIIIA